MPKNAWTGLYRPPKILRTKIDRLGGEAGTKWWKCSYAEILNYTLLREEKKARCRVGRFALIGRIFSRNYRVWRENYYGKKSNKKRTQRKVEFNFLKFALLFFVDIFAGKENSFLRRKKQEKIRKIQHASEETLIDKCIR